MTNVPIPQPIVFPFRIQTAVSNGDGEIITKLALERQTNKSAIARQAIHEGLKVITGSDK